MTTTCATVVRDAMLSRLQAKPYFTNFARKSKTRALQVQPEQIPFLGVYFINELMIPEGDANAGEPRFHASARYGFSVIVQNNDPDLAEDQLDLAFVQITDLFKDASLYLNAGTLNGETVRIQSYTRGERVHTYGAAGLNNELPTAEMRFELTVDLGMITYPPEPLDDLITYHVETAFPTVERRDEVVQVMREWEWYRITAADLFVAAPELGAPALTLPD